jgi:hypothetical protein
MVASLYKYANILDMHTALGMLIERLAAGLPGSTSIKKFIPGVLACEMQ